MPKANSCGQIAFVGLAFLIGSLSANSVAQPQPTQTTENRSGLPTLLLVHGRGQSEGTQSTVEAQWHEALDVGLQRAGAAGIIPRTSRHLYWYADALAKRWQCSGDMPGSLPVERIIELRDYFADLGRQLPSSAQLSFLEWGMKDTALYLSNTLIQCFIESTLARQLEALPKSRGAIIAVTHSMGSMVVYKALMHRLYEFHRPVYFITIGSMLGEPAVQRALLGSLVTSPGIPQPIVWWRNIINKGDLLAFPAAQAFTTEFPQKQPVDVSIDSKSADPHDAIAYLSSAEVGRVVHTAWCMAAPTSRSCEKATKP
jgi:hypothetical protein